MHATDFNADLPRRCGRRTDAELRAAIAAVDSWYHQIDFGNGVVTPGHFKMERYLAHYPFPASLAGKRAIDIGCSNGWFSLQFERLGAYEVVAVDLPGWGAHDWSDRYMAEYLAKSQMERSGIDRALFGVSFELVRSELSNGAIRRHEARVYDLDPKVVGSFDFVFCGSALMHMRDPLLALITMRRLAAPGATLVVSTSLPPDTNGPTATFVGDWRYSNFWQISPQALSRMLAFAGWDERGTPARYEQRSELAEFVDHIHVTSAVAATY